MGKKRHTAEQIIGPMGSNSADGVPCMLGSTDGRRHRGRI
jgi:hypothetical protein